MGWYARYCILFCSYAALSGVGLIVPDTFFYCIFGVSFVLVFQNMPLVKTEYSVCHGERVMFGEIVGSKGYSRGLDGASQG